LSFTLRLQLRKELYPEPLRDGRGGSMNASATLPVVRTKGLSILGITGFLTVANGFTGIPSLYVSGYTSPYQLPESQPTEETFQYIDQMTYERGARTIKAGVEYRPMAFGSFSYSSQCLRRLPAWFAGHDRLHLHAHAGVCALLVSEFLRAGRLECAAEPDSIAWRALRV
jgi:hypothetical protein